MSNKTIYRIAFSNQETVYEVYARHVGESDMFGFLEIEEFVFGETTQLLVDPSEERLKNEFSGVKRTYIPMHSVLRIDEVEKEGTAKIRDKKGNNVSNFPHALVNKREDK
jgi:Uncharacterized protein conserved in bacteria